MNENRISQNEPLSDTRFQFWMDFRQPTLAVEDAETRGGMGGRWLLNKYDRSIAANRELIADRTELAGNIFETGNVARPGANRSGLALSIGVRL
jgi:hypothetical protein